MPVKKLPKNKHVLKRFIEVYDDKVKDANAMRPKDKCAVAKEASKVISEELKEVWSLHFGIFAVYGKMTIEDEEDPTVMIVIRQDNIGIHNSVFEVTGRDIKNIRSTWL